MDRRAEFQRGRWEGILFVTRSVRNNAGEHRLLDQRRLHVNSFRLALHNILPSYRNWPVRSAAYRNSQRSAKGRRIESLSETGGKLSRPGRSCVRQRLKAFPASQAPVSHKSASIGYPWFSPYSGNLAQAGISLPQMPLKTLRIKMLISKNCSAVAGLAPLPIAHTGS